MKGAEMFHFKFFCLISITTLLLNCTYTILEHRSLESIENIKELPERMDIVYITPPEPIKPGPPFKPDPTISEPIKEITQPDKEDSFKKRPFDKRNSSNVIESRNSLTR
jgi:hypothetical protein